MTTWLSEWFSEWMSGWVIEWLVDEWMDEWMGTWMGKWVSQCVAEWTSKWMAEWESKLTSERWVRESWMDGWMKNWMGVGGNIESASRISTNCRCSLSHDRWRFLFAHTGSFCSQWCSLSTEMGNFGEDIFCSVGPRLPRILMETL